METLLSERQAAEKLGLARITLRNWRRAGNGPRHVQLGRSIRYTLQSLEEFVANHQGW
jgi:predicted DNA-binding transcriptional regulator AlpA